MAEDLLPHKRQRVSKACDTCRRKKVKCDGVQPRCGNCNAFGFECTYNDTTKKRGPPKGYIEAIENRLHRMESLLGGLVQSNDPRAEAVLAELMQDDLGPPAPRRSATSRPDYSSWRNNLASAPSATTQSEGNNKDADGDKSSPPKTIGPDGKQVDDLNDVMGVLSIDENNQVRYHGRSSGFYLLKKSNRYKDGVLRVQNQSPGQVIVASTNEFELLKHPELTELPSQELSDYLLEIYFNHVHPILPIIYKPTFFSRLKSQENFPHLLLNAMFALAARYSDKEEIQSFSGVSDKPESTGDVFADRARTLLDFEYDHSRVSTVQALILMSLREFGSAKVTRAWMYAGMATRMAQDLGLHRNTENWHPIHYTHEEKEAQKRTFWGCFVLDRICSANLGRPMCIDEMDVDVPHPSEEEEDEVEFLPFRMESIASTMSSPISSTGSIQGSPGQPSSARNASPPPAPTSTQSKFPHHKSHAISRFNALTKLCKIIGKIVHGIYAIRSSTKSSNKESVLSILDSSLTSWLVNLPVHLQYDPTSEEQPAPATVVLHIMYQSILMLLHRAYIGVSQSQLKHTSAANSLTDLADILIKNGQMPYAMNSTLYAVFMAGVLHTYNATQSDPNISQPAKVNLRKCLKALAELRKTWWNATKYANLLAELADLRDVKLEAPPGGGSDGQDDGNASGGAHSLNNAGNQQGSSDWNSQHRLQDQYRQQSNPSESSQNNSRTVTDAASAVPSQQQPPQPPPPVPATSVLSFTSLTMPQYPSTGQTSSQQLHRIDDSYNHPFRYLSAFAQDSQQGTTAMSIDSYGTNIVGGNNGGGGGGNFDAALSTAYWGIPPHADLTEWSSFMQQMQNGVTFHPVPQSGAPDVSSMVHSQQQQ